MKFKLSDKNDLSGQMSERIDASYPILQCVDDDDDGVVVIFIVVLCCSF